MISENISISNEASSSLKDESKKILPSNDEEPKTEASTPEKFFLSDEKFLDFSSENNSSIFLEYPNFKFDFDLLNKMKLIRDPSKGLETVENIIKTMILLEENHEAKNIEYILNIRDQFFSNKIVLGTPILSNILSETRPLNACTVIPMNLRKNSVNQMAQKFTKYSECGIGSGFDLDEVDDPCETIEKINEATRKVNKNLFARDFCCIGTLTVESPKIKEFIDLKLFRDYSSCHYNISVKITDKFMEELIKFNKEENKNILIQIAKAIHYCGEPGILFMDSFNRYNPIPKYEYKSVAPCAEIAMSEGDVCQFSYINLSKFVNENLNKNLNKIKFENIKDVLNIIDWDTLKKTVKYLTRSLDNLIDITIKNSIDDNSIVKDKRRIAVGACGFADLLAILKIPYDSKSAIILAKNIFSFMNYHSKLESIELAKERGAFPCFNESRYVKEEFVERFIDTKNEVLTVTKEEWKKLAKDIKKFGIRNSSTNALPPTGRCAALVGASYSIEPYFSLKECKFIDEKLSEDEKKNIYKIATEIEPIKHIEMLSEINKFIDDSISKTVNLPNKTTIMEIYELIIKAYQMGIKGITFFRDRSLEERTTSFKNKGVKGY